MKSKKFTSHLAKGHVLTIVTTILTQKILLKNYENTKQFLTDRAYLGDATHAHYLVATGDDHVPTQVFKSR